MNNSATAGDAMATVQRMIEAWRARDWDAVADLFDPDGALVIIPLTAYRGRDAIRAHLNEVASNIDSLEFDVRNLSADGTRVYFERDDVFVYNGNPGRVPVVGVLEVKDAKVLEWREYFDLNTMIKAMTVKTGNGGS